MNKTVLFALCMMTAGIANAQTKDGGISKQQLQQIEAQQANKANKAFCPKGPICPRQCRRK